MQSRLSADVFRKAMAGDSHAFRLVVEEHQGFAYAVAFRFLRNNDDAEDITQEAFIRLWKNMEHYKQEIKLTTWLYRIITNLCLDLIKTTHRKQSKNKMDLLSAHHVADSLTPEDELQHRELLEAIDKASEELTPKQKAVFILRDLESLSVEEVCSVLSMSAGNVKSNLYYARQKINASLQVLYQLKTKTV